MHPDTHLLLHHLRSAELRGRADDFHLARTLTPRRRLRTRLAWALVETGLRLMPDHTTAPCRTPRAA